MTSTLMNSTKNTDSLSENMQRMITPQYEQIVNEIENIYHHPETGFFVYSFALMCMNNLFRTYYHCSMASSPDFSTKQKDKYITDRQSQCW